MNHNPQTAADQQTVDTVAHLMGTTPEWNADTLEAIADLVGQVRPHPGDPTNYPQPGPADEMPLFERLIPVDSADAQALASVAIPDDPDRLPDTDVRRDLPITLHGETPVEELSLALAPRHARAIAHGLIEAADLINDRT